MENCFSSLQCGTQQWDTSADITRKYKWYNLQQLNQWPNQILFKRCIWKTNLSGTWVTKNVNSKACRWTDPLATRSYVIQNTFSEPKPTCDSPNNVLKPLCSWIITIPLTCSSIRQSTHDTTIKVIFSCWGSRKPWDRRANGGCSNSW